MDPMEMFKKKFDAYKKILDESGEVQAWSTLFEGYPERQKKNMGPLIENSHLAEGFKKTIPMMKQMGMIMDVIDVSNNDMESILEIQNVCPVLEMSKEYGLNKPCRLICEMDVESTKAAFPGMKGDVLATIADGHCVCILKYERPKK